MFGRTARIPVIEGVIDRRILANYRLDPDAAAAQLPAPFRPKLVNGYAIGGLCLIRLEKVRPAFLPVNAGIRSENAAHRFAVVWDDQGVEREGVYIPRRDTDSRLNALAGGRLFPGVHHHAVFDVSEQDGHFCIGFQSDDGLSSMRISAHVTEVFPSGSVFADLDKASTFFKDGILGYSATADPRRFDALELHCKQWSVQPLEVDEVQSSFFDALDRFPAGSAVFDCALLMRGIRHEWRQQADLCCSSFDG